jgi:hypothetical protein
MQQEPTVTVYNFRVQRARPEELDMAPFKAPRETIRALGGEPLAGTAEDVPRDQLDEQGRYRRIATGWGALD